MAIVKSQAVQGGGAGSRGEALSGNRELPSSVLECS